MHKSVEATARFRILSLIILLSCAFGLKAKTNFYRAAVLELAQFTNISYPAKEILKINLDIYEVAAKTAALQGADIIIYPESGLLPFEKPNREWMLSLIEDLPDPKQEVANPCSQTSEFENRPILTKLSCLAKHNKLYVVANTADFKKCNVGKNCYKNENKHDSNCTTCPDDGYFFYNTNVVFDKEGTLLAKYYKRHLYFEPEMNTPDFPEDTYFETEFGKFTTVICFDLMFKESVKALEIPEIHNVAYPTYWFDHVPFIFFATPYQQAWAMANNVNLLAANAHHPPTGSLGSGIYSPTKGALIYTHNPDGRSKLLISNVPILPHDDSADTIQLKSKRFIIEDGTAIAMEGEENRDFKNECENNILKDTPKNETDYRCGPTTVDHYQFRKLTKKEGSIEICSNNFCCSLFYQADSMNETFFFGVTGEDLNFYKSFMFGTESCFLARCESFEGKSCTNYILKSHTVFRKVEIKGNFSTDHILPFAIDSEIRLTVKSKWNFDQKSQIVYSNGDDKSPLLFLGLYGRLFDHDKDIFHQPDKVPQSQHLRNGLIIGFTCLGVILLGFLAFKLYRRDAKIFGAFRKTHEWDVN